VTSQSRDIALFGATGTAGRATTLALVEAGHHVTAFGRTDPQIAGVPFTPVDVTNPFTLPPQDAVVSCLASRTGVPQDAWAIDHAANVNVLNAAQAAGIAQFLLLSAICVQKPRLAFQHAKLAFEEALIASGLTYSIIRPTAFFKSLSGQIDRLRAGKPFLMFGDGRLTACKPLSDRDLGMFIAGCLADPERQNQILPIGGPGPALTSEDIGTALFHALDLPPKFRRVPLSLFTLIGGTLRLGGLFSPRLKQKAELARIGHYYASESMLLWDPGKNRYDAATTPETGRDTLADHFAALAAGEITANRGDHAIF
jgi:divinyl chlorophyllide a 8-vinyl-reductase